MTEQVSLSSSGWAVVTWAQDNVTNERFTNDTLRYIDQDWQFEMRWLSPTGALGPVIALGPAHVGRECFQSKCPGKPPIPAVEAIGPERALVVMGSPHLTSEEVNGAGHITAMRTISHEAAFTSPEAMSPGSPVAFGGHTFVVTWGGGYSKQCEPIHAVQWQWGHWSRPTVIARPATSKCVYEPTAHANSRGQASVIWFRETVGYTGFPKQGYMQGVFNF
jgi:hypothetical protein